MGGALQCSSDSKQQNDCRAGLLLSVYKSSAHTQPYVRPMTCWNSLMSQHAPCTITV